MSTSTKTWDVPFDNLVEALEGVTTLMLTDIKLVNDGVERWYRVIPTPAK